jgi:hypothetical protein
MFLAAREASPVMLISVSDCRGFAAAGASRPVLAPEAVIFLAMAFAGFLALRAARVSFPGLVFVLGVFAATPASSTEMGSA